MMPIAAIPPFSLIIRRRPLARLLVLGAFVAAFGACNSSNPTAPSSTPTTVPSATPTATLAPLVVGLNATRGWSSVRISVDGSFIGTLTKPVDQAVQGCQAISGQQLTTQVAPGDHVVSATPDSGSPWNYTTSVPTGMTSNQCWTVTLYCTNNDCSTGSTAAPPPTPATIAAPTPSTPRAGQQLNTLRPTLTVTNVPTAGTVGNVTYRFEISELASFPDGSRTLAQDGVPQGGGGTTTWVATHDVMPNYLYYWRARATNGAVIGGWSAVETFRSAVVIQTPTPTPTPTPNPGSSVAFIVGLTASKGWSSVNVSVDGVSLGTLTKYVASLSCSAIPGAQLLTRVAPGSHTVTAVSDGGTRWNVTTTVPDNLTSSQCWEVKLTCTNEDCSPSQSLAPPPAQQTGRNPIGATTTTFRNRTPYSLQISLSGPVSRSLTVAAGGSQTVTLSPGQYDETVHAIGGNVSPYNGRQTYLQGYDYDQTFTLISR